MNILEILDRRIAIWKVKLAKAEGRYHTATTSGTERERLSYMAECRRYQAVLCELEDVREEIGRSEHD